MSDYFSALLGTVASPVAATGLWQVVQSSTFCQCITCIICPNGGARRDVAP